MTGGSTAEIGDLSLKPHVAEGGVIVDESPDVPVQLTDSVRLRVRRPEEA
jgi:hypothetical protein